MGQSTWGVQFVDSSSLAMSETSATSAGGKVKAQKQKGELDEQLRDYINEWRKTREKEEEELKKLKEKQAKRKESELRRRRSSDKKRTKRRPRKLKKRRRSLKKLKLQGKKCLKPRRLELEQTRRSLLLVEPVEMPAEK